MSTIKVVSQTVDGFRQEASVGSFVILFDVAQRLGGSNQGATPMEVLLAALGSCTAMTLQAKARQRKWDLQKVTVTVQDTVTTDPNQAGKKIPGIQTDIVLEGNLTADQVDKLKAAANHCHVHKILTNGIAVKTVIALQSPPAPPAVPPSQP